VLRKLANQGGKQRHFARLPVSLREHSSAVGTDVFRDCPFSSPGLFQAGQVDLDWERVAFLNSRIENSSDEESSAAYCDNHLARLNSQLARFFLDFAWSASGTVLKARRNGQSQEAQVSRTGMPSTLALPLSIRGNGVKQ